MRFSSIFQMGIKNQDKSPAYTFPLYFLHWHNSPAGEDGEVTYSPQDGASMQNEALQQQVSSSLDALHFLNFDEGWQKVGCLKSMRCLLLTSMQ